MTTNKIKKSVQNIEEKELEKDSLAFWGEPLNTPNQPFDSLRKKQLLLQLKEQFNINPREWKYKGDSSEGRTHSSHQGAVTNCSGEIDNLGKKVSFWYDWQSKCDKTPGSSSYTKCSNNSPEECGMKFYVDLLGELWFNPDGGLKLKNAIDVEKFIQKIGAKKCTKCKVEMEKGMINGNCWIPIKVAKSIICTASNLRGWVCPKCKKFFLAEKNLNCHSLKIN